MNIADSDVAVFHQDRVALLRGLFREWVEPLWEGVAEAMAHPSFHDHVLVKHPGNSTVTPWHQDQPYYCVQGERTVSFWTPLDPVSRNVCMECVAGSHTWNRAGYRPVRFDGPEFPRIFPRSSR